MEIPACMGMDAFRLCVGKQPRNFTAQAVLEYLASKVEAAKAVIERWDTPNWKDAGPTADVISRLRKSVDELLRRGFRQEGGND